MIELVINFMATGWFKLFLFVFSTIFLGFVIQKKIDEELALVITFFIVVATFTNYFLNHPLSPIQTVGLLFLAIVLLDIWGKANERE